MVYTACDSRLSKQTESTGNTRDKTDTGVEDLLIKWAEAAAEEANSAWTSAQLLHSGGLQRKRTARVHTETHTHTQLFPATQTGNNPAHQANQTAGEMDAESTQPCEKARLRDSRNNTDDLHITGPVGEARKVRYLQRESIETKFHKMQRDLQ